MRTRRILFAAALAAFIEAGYGQAAQAAAADALSGRVSSAAEGPMAGVVVSAKKQGSNITVSVISGADGTFQFPDGRLAPGRYAITIRAVGYDLSPSASATIAEEGPAPSLDLKLNKVNDISQQLTNAAWLQSMPGTDAQKKFLLNCNSCHSYQRIVRSKYDAAGFMQIFQLMVGFYPGSTPLHPQVLVGSAKRNLSHGANMQNVAKWLSTVNLHDRDAWSYPLKPLPRLTDPASTHVVITEYDLPSPLIEPHDVVMDSKGMVWFSDFGEMQLGELDPKTGKVTLYPVPTTKPGFPTGSLDLEIDSKDNVWLGMMYQASLAKFDQKTKKFQMYSIPKKWNSDAAQFGHLAVYGEPTDGKIWIKNSAGDKIYRFDPKTGAWEDFGSYKNPVTGKKIGTYGIYSDAQNNLYLLDYSAGDIGRIDAKTKAFTDYQTPIAGSRPRRGRVDSQGRLWFGEYAGNAIGMFDPKTKKIEEWVLPTPWSAPYDAVYDRFGDAWTGSMMTDRVDRLNVATGKFTEYQLPRSTNIRRVFVDDRTKPGTLWIGSNHGASIVSVEPLR